MSHGTDYDVFYIQNPSRKPMNPRLTGKTQTVTISVPGQDIHWCPINEDHHSPEKRRVYANKTMGHFQFKELPKNFNI